jgi:hypothetical protein
LAFQETEPELKALVGEPLQDLAVATPSNPAVERAWIELYRTLSGAPRRLVFVPALDSPEPRLADLLPVMEASGAWSDTIIVATDETERPIPDWLPRQAQWRSYADLGQSLTPSDRALLTTTVLHSLKPEATFAVGSEAFTSAVLNHGAALGSLMALHIWWPAVRTVAQASQIGLLAMLPNLQALYLEDDVLQSLLIERYGLPDTERRKLKVLRRPWLPAEPSVVPNGKRNRKVLWIGNPDPQSEATLRHAFARFAPDATLELRHPEAATINRSALSSDYGCLLLTEPLDAAVDVLFEAAKTDTPVVHLGDGPLGAGTSPVVVDANALFTRDGLAVFVAEAGVRAVLKVRQVLTDEASRRTEVSLLKTRLAEHHRWADFQTVLTCDGGFFTPSRAWGNGR